MTLPEVRALVAAWRERVHAIGRDVGSYRQCADELERALPAESGWVSVEERLPEQQKMVLLHCAGGNNAGSVIYGYYGFSGEVVSPRDDFYMMHSGGRYYPVSEAGSPVTHWRALPPPPTKEG